MTLWVPAGTPVKRVACRRSRSSANLFTPGPLSWTFAPGSDAAGLVDDGAGHRAAGLGCAWAGSANASSSPSDSSDPLMRQRFMAVLLELSVGTACRLRRRELYHSRRECLHGS